MAKPNYSFEKRQRDLAKKKKKEEKRLRKQGPVTEPVDEAKPAADDAAKNLVWPSQDDSPDKS